MTELTRCRCCNADLMMCNDLKSKIICGTLVVFCSNCEYSYSATFTDNGRLIIFEEDGFVE